ncbi:hypothetical protein ACOSP7_023822 [Xanthoceras sorbifolium]
MAFDSVQIEPFNMVNPTCDDQPEPTRLGRQSSRPVVAPPGRVAHWSSSTAFIASTPRGALVALVVAMLTARISFFFITSSSSRSMVAVTDRGAHCQESPFFIASGSSRSVVAMTRLRYSLS